MSVDELWQPVRTVPLFVDEIKKSISMGGLMNPIIVVRTPREDVVRHYQDKHKAISETLPENLPDTPVMNTIWGGSNRLDAVKQLGYTHVDCVLIPDFFTAMRVQTEQRNAYDCPEQEVNDGAAGDTIK